MVEDVRLGEEEVEQREWCGKREDAGVVLEEPRRLDEPQWSDGELQPSEEEEV